MSNTPDNDVIKLYEEIANLRNLVESQNKKIATRDKQLEEFMKISNLAISKIENIGIIVSNISEMFPLISDFFGNYKRNLQ